MPATATLTNNASVAAFTVPQNALGFILWNTSAADLRVRLGKPAAASGANEGIPIPAGSASSPQRMVHYFGKPPRQPVVVQIFQGSGGNITSGVGYDILMD